ncbi:alpha/beta fold hydrolase [Cupriavidus sp. 2TAF22]|uniref:alpha/beta fold hydrolase n=1 Tax=unclassified Cupriavidus TaxID=2640874 RepID=UPI003F9385B1
MTILIACIAIVIAIAAIVILGLVAFSALIARKVEKALPPRGKFIEIDGARLHYIDQGQGPAIVMVHGLGGQTGNFSYALLERLTSRFRVILVDRPGSGYSTRPAGMSARLSKQSEVIARFIRALELEDPLLVGHSLGGAVALGVALDHPGTAAGLALIAPLTHPVQGVPASFRALAVSPAALRRVVAWTLAIPRSILRGRAMVEFVFSPERPPADFGTAGGGLLGLRPGAFYAASTDMNSLEEDLPSMAGRYASLALPISILYGTADAVLDWRIHGQAMKDKLPALELELVPGGHMLPVTIPDQAAAWLSAAVERTRSTLAPA